MKILSYSFKSFLDLFFRVFILFSLFLSSVIWMTIWLAILHVRLSILIKT
jgi:hypothetical protein